MELTVKADYNGDVRRVPVWLPPCVTAGPRLRFTAVREAVLSGFDWDDGAVDFSMKYVDVDGDLCTLAATTVQDALSRTGAASPLRLLITRNDKSTPMSCPTEKPPSALRRVCGKSTPKFEHVKSEPLDQRLAKRICLVSQPSSPSTEVPSLASLLATKVEPVGSLREFGTLRSMPSDVSSSQRVRTNASLPRQASKLYLPMVAPQGPLLHELGAGRYRVTTAAGFRKVACRRSKVWSDITDKQLVDGSIFVGHDEGDGWVRIKRCGKFGVARRFGQPIKYKNTRVVAKVATKRRSRIHVTDRVMKTTESKERGLSLREFPTNLKSAAWLNYTAEHRASIAIVAQRDWQSEFEAFLSDSGMHIKWFGSPCSKANINRCRRQIRLLASGEGVKHPSRDAIFWANIKLQFTDDIIDIIDQTYAFFDTHGPDTSQSWALKQPLTKLLSFQRTVGTQGRVEELVKSP